MVRPLPPQKNYLLNIYYVLGTRYGAMNKLAWFLFSQLPVEWKRLLLNTEQLNYFKLWLSAPRKREVCSGDLGEGVQGHPHWENGIWVVRTSQSGGCLEKNLPNGAIACSEARVWGGDSVLELMKASVIMWLLPTWTLGEATGRQREATGNWEWGGLSEFASWRNEGFHSLCCLTGLLILVEPKATLHVEVQGMADVAIKEPLTSWWPIGDIGSLGAPLVRVSGELQPCSDECAFLGRFFGPGVSSAFGKGVLWERVIVWWLGLGQKRSTWLILPPLGLLVGYLSSLSMC